MMVCRLICLQGGSSNLGMACEQQMDESKAELDERAARAPHLATTAGPVDYEVVVPTYRRWRSTQEVTKKKRFKDSNQPFILDHTLGFLSREDVPKERVTLFVANEGEEKEYRKALEGSAWANVRIQISMPGVRDSRNFIYKFFPADTYVVSLDDDMEGVKWKIREGSDTSSCIDLPRGHFLKIVRDAYQRMKETGAFLWGLSTSQNPRFLVMDDVSMRNGLVNGYLHGFICRPDAAPDLLRRLPDAVEDAEFSVRHFAKDKVVLRYRMYAGVTSPYTNGGGLQSKFHVGGSIRKSEEWCGAQQLHELFPTLIAAPSEGDKCRQNATEVRFISQTGLGVKARKFAVRRLKGLCRFMIPQLKGKEKRKTALAALARLKAFAVRKQKKQLPALKKVPEASGSRKLSGQAVPQAERPLLLLGEDKIRFAPNPKKKGTDAHRRYAKYSRAKKVSELTALGCKNIDFRYDLKSGFLKVVELDTRPASNECMVEDDPLSPAPHPPSGRARSAQVRLTEVTGKHPGLFLSKESLLPLQHRCPALQGSWALCAAKGGPLSKISLPCFRILLHWTKTGRLVFAHNRAAELHAALQVLGAKTTAERLREWMTKRELKFSLQSPQSLPADELCGHSNTGEAPTLGEASAPVRKRTRTAGTMPGRKKACNKTSANTVKAGSSSPQTVASAKAEEQTGKDILADIQRNPEAAAMTKDPVNDSAPPSLSEKDLGAGCGDTGLESLKAADKNERTEGWKAESKEPERISKRPRGQSVLSFSFSGTDKNQVAPATSHLPSRVATSDRMDSDSNKGEMARPCEETPAEPVAEVKSAPDPSPSHEKNSEAAKIQHKEEDGQVTASDFVKFCVVLLEEMFR
ncbi:unnamed protein product [Durusdinium trenchii]|uniref:Uncharacterized protein n=1 Tax=Durusdinium trenchii TaxID=1381693 RepID=A0ABP0RXM3_9DINO